jgi:hypothetical protein
MCKLYLGVEKEVVCIFSKEFLGRSDASIDVGCSGALVALPLRTLVDFHDLSKAAIATTCLHHSEQTDHIFTSTRPPPPQSRESTSTSL